jgi:hypothetical protein
MAVNILLLVLDIVIFFPVTLLRLLIIYLNGSRYNIPGLEILDIIMHSKNPKFNTKKIHTEDTNIKESLKKMLKTDTKKTEHKNLESTSSIEIETNSGTDVGVEKTKSVKIDSDSIFELMKTADKTQLNKIKINNELKKVTKLVAELIETKKTTDTSTISEDSSENEYELTFSDKMNTN